MPYVTNHNPDKPICAWVIPYMTKEEVPALGTWLAFPTTEIPRRLCEPAVFVGRGNKNVVKRYACSIDHLHRRLPATVNLEELNYLASLLAGLSTEKQHVFLARIEGLKDGDMAGFINTANDLAGYKLVNDFVSYGMERLRAEGVTSAVISAFTSQQLAEYGRAQAAGHDPQATSFGYLFKTNEAPGSVMGRYRGPQDIPDEHRLKPVDDKKKQAKKDYTKKER